MSAPVQIQADDSRVLNSTRQQTPGIRHSLSCKLQTFRRSWHRERSRRSYEG